MPSLTPLWANSSWTFNGSGSWSVASNWLGGVPTNGADVFIVQVGQGGSTNRTITYDYTGAAVTLGDLKVDDTNSGGGIDTLSQSTNTLTAGYEYIGLDGRGAFTQGGGTNTFNSFLLVGDHAGSTGTYTLSAGMLNGTGTGAGPQVMNVGNEGAGTFDQSGGTVTLASNVVLSIGDAATATGTYMLSGDGMLNVVGGEYVGMNGTGNFSQTGGSNTTSLLNVANGTLNGSGTYTLGSGTLTMHGLTVGVSTYGAAKEIGAFIQTGGTDSGQYLDLEHGAYTLSGGTLSVVGGEGTLSLGGGIEYISSDAGSAVFIQTGGINIIGSEAYPGNLYVGISNILIATNASAYLLSGTGQTNVHGNVDVGGSELYDYQSLSAILSIGGSGSASGGSMTVSDLLTIWGESGANRAVNLGTGGFLSVGSIDVSGNPSLLQWTAGTLQFTNNIDIGSVNFFDQPTLDLTNKTLVLAGGMTIQPDSGFAPSSGTVIIPAAVSVGNRGLFNQASGQLNIDGAFVNSGTASFGGTQVWGPDSVFVNLAGVSTFSSTLGPTGPVVVITGGSVNFNAPLQLQSLTLNSAPASITATGNKTLTVKSLAIYGNGKLDLANNDMVIDYSGPVGTLVNDVRQYLQAGQLTSSLADASHRLGYADNALLGLTSFGGQTVDSTSLLIKYTYGGDANLDGKVDIADLKMLASHWNQSGQFWTGGDFNYDGVVNVADLVVLAKDWQNGVNSPLALSLPTVLTSLGLPDVTIPEPVGLGAFALLISSLKRPRRRRRAGATM